MRSDLLNAFAMVAAVLAFALAGPWLWRQLESLPEHRALAARAGERIVTLEVGGMTCAGCASKVRGELASVVGVSAAEVRLGQERAYVVCARELPDSALVSAVSRAGPGFMAAVVPK